MHDDDRALHLFNASGHGSPREWGGSVDAARHDEARAGFGGVPDHDLQEGDGVKPYYDADGITIYHGDCREILPHIPTPEVVFTDPPYGIAYKSMRGAGEGTIANDASATTAFQVVEFALRSTVSASAHFVCCDWRSLATVTEAMLATSLKPKACIVWDKKRTVQNLDRFGKQHEFILYAGPYGGEPTVSSDVWPVARDFDPDHPTPKPVELIQRAISAASLPGDLVLDPFMGSGSTLRAALNLGRRAIGIELEERYCEIAVQRLAQMNLDLGTGA